MCVVCLHRICGKEEIPPKKGKGGGVEGGRDETRKKHEEEGTLSLQCSSRFLLTPVDPDRCGSIESWTFT